MRRGLDISDCERETKIRGKYLRALEEEEFGMLPDPAYIKGFLRAYGEYLDVDPQLLLDEYASRFEPASDNHHEVQPLPPRRGRWAPRASPGSRSPEFSPAPRAARRSRRRLSGLPLLALAIGAAVAVGPIVWFGSTGSGSSAGPRERLVGAPLEAGAPERRSVPGVGAGTWVEVGRGGRRGAVLYRGLVADGERRAFTAPRRIWVRIASGANARVVAAGRQVATRDGQAYVVTRSGLAAAA